mgnify:CR=1 FL=1
MKKLALSITTAILLLFVAPVVQAATGVPPATTSSAPAPEAARAEALKTRLHEIKKTDKSNMSAAEKKQLRKEKKAVKKELRAVSGGIYISAGALIVILLVLLILT